MKIAFVIIPCSFSSACYVCTLPKLAFDFFRTGSEPELAPVSTGSHTDAIPYSGKYDGVVDMLGSIEAINVLKWYVG